MHCPRHMEAENVLRGDINEYGHSGKGKQDASIVCPGSRWGLILSILYEVQDLALGFSWASQ